MAYEVTKDRVDYTWVITQQVERVARVATEYWKTPRARQQYKLAELRGAIRVLLDLADPVVKGGVNGLYQELAKARSYSEVMQVYRRVARMLQQAGLLVRKSSLGEEW